MKLDKDLFRLEHIIDSIEKIEELTRLLHSYDNFEKKWMKQFPRELLFDPHVEIGGSIKANIIFSQVLFQLLSSLFIHVLI